MSVRSVHLRRKRHRKLTVASQLCVFSWIPIGWAVYAIIGSRREQRLENEKKLHFADARSAFNDLQTESPTFTISNRRTWLETTQNAGSSISFKAKHWYAHTNVCVDGSDGVKYLREVGSYTIDMQALGLFENVSTKPLMPRPLEIGAMDGNARTVLLKGNNALLHCWRSFRPTPLHFLLGYGALYSAIRANQFNRSLDNVVFHQCPAPFDGGEFFTSFWRILYKFGTDRKVLTPTTRFFSISKTSPLFCMESVAGNEYVAGNFFGGNISDFLSFKEYFHDYLSTYLHYSPFAFEKQQLYDEGGDIRTGAVTTGRTRVAIFQKAEGVNGMRRFVNLAQVIELVRTFDVFLMNITVTSDMGLIETFETFNSFDILITPIGSHQANLLFTQLRRKVAIIEVVSTCIEANTMHWLQPRMKYTISSGHTPADHKLQRLVDHCSKVRGGQSCAETEGCNSKQLGKIITADMIVNIDILRGHFAAAVQYVSARGGRKRLSVKGMQHLDLNLRRAKT